MKLKKILLFTMVLSLMGGVVQAAPAKSTLTAAKAQEIARKYVPSASKHISTDSDDDDYEVTYYNKQTKEKFEIEIDKDLHKIVKFKSERHGDDGSSKVKYSKADIRKIAEKEVAGSAIKAIVLDQDDDDKEYDLTIETPSYYGMMEINPETGIIMEREYKIGKRGATVSTNQYRYLISYAKAKEIALQKVPGAIVTEIELDKDEKQFVYEVEMYHNGFKYELDINAKTGAGMKLKKSAADIDDLDWDRDDVDLKFWEQLTTSSSSLITAERAKQIALNKAQGGKITSLELDEDDGKLVYEGEVVKGDYEYEFEIDAYSGLIIDWEADEIDD